MAKQKIKVIREEMLQVANNVALEKNIEKNEVFHACEQCDLMLYKQYITLRQYTSMSNELSKD